MALTLNFDVIPDFVDEQNQDSDVIEKNMISLIEEYFPDNIIIFNNKTIKIMLLTHMRI